VALTIDASSSPVCSISGSQVRFIGSGTCTIDANQEGDSNYNPAPQVQQGFPVGGKPQSIGFTSVAPTSAIVGGASYAVSASASSGLPVVLTVDGTSAGVCTISGSTVSFIGAGICTIDVNQEGNAQYMPALQVQQTVAVVAPLRLGPVVPGGIGPLLPSPNSTFSTGATAFNQTTGVLTITTTVGDPGTFSWLLTFQNGKFGVFAASNQKCKARFVRLAGKCRPSMIVFAKGSQAVAGAGAVTLKLKPSASALKALKNALKQRKGLPVTITLTFQSARGGTPVSHTRVLTVKLKKK
jgi:hypothetical protein